jgi:hypothetical protein
MLRVICPQKEEVVIKNDLAEIAGRACWIDLIEPSGNELDAVSRGVGIDFRTRTRSVAEEANYMRVSAVRAEIRGNRLSAG